MLIVIRLNNLLPYLYLDTYVNDEKPQSYLEYDMVLTSISHQNKSLLDAFVQEITN